MSIFSSIISDATSSFVRNVVGIFKAPAEQVEQHAFEIQKMQMDMAEKLQEAMTREVEAASANIRAEAQSGDKYTSRARPSFIYLMLAVLGCNYILFPLIGKPPISYPDALFWLFGSCMLGYTGARTWEKFMGLPGESSIQLPFGIKASNDGGKGK